MPESGPRAAESTGSPRSISPFSRVDLHVHTNRSDGRLAPEDLLCRAFEARLDVLAITDHDLPPPLEPGVWSWGGRALHLLAGVELTTIHEGAELHLLAYFPGAVPERFTAFLRERSRERAQRFVDAGRRLGLPDAWLGDGFDPAIRTVTRGNLARVLIRAGRASSVDEACAGLLHPGAGILEPVELETLAAIAVCAEAGALTSWAHPSLEQANAWTRTFRRAGLDALEANRPGLGRRQRVTLRRLAEKNGLLASGGSDWHGFGPPVLGSFAAPGLLVQPFLSRLGWTIR